MRLPERDFIQMNVILSSILYCAALCFYSLDAYLNDQLTLFHRNLMLYISHISFLDFSVSVPKVPEKSSYVIYEFWRDRLSWMRSVLALNVFAGMSWTLHFNHFQKVSVLKSYTSLITQNVFKLFFHFSATCSLAAAKPSSAASSTCWRTLRLCLQCCSQVGIYVNVCLWVWGRHYHPFVLFTCFKFGSNQTKCEIAKQTLK